MNPQQSPEVITSIHRKLASIQWGERENPYVLIVDDEIRLREELKTMLEFAGYRVDVAANGREAMQKIEAAPPDLIITDITIRYMTGFQLCRNVKANPETRDIPVILVTGLQRPEDKIKGIEAGATDFVGKPFDRLELQTRVASVLEMKRMHAQLENIDEIIMAFARTIDARDPYTRGHSERVGKYGIKFGAALGMEVRQQELLFKGAILHDIGKIGVRDSVLLKRGKLTDSEYSEIKKHPAIGLNICAPLKSSRSLLNIVAYHHERMDGKGYPFGLMGEEIPVEARIIAVCDCFDALTSVRPYRDALSVEEASDILERGMGAHFDEDLLPMFLEIARLGELQEIVDDARTLGLSSDSQAVTSEIVRGLDLTGFEIGG